MKYKICETNSTKNNDKIGAQTDTGVDSHILMSIHMTMVLYIYIEEIVLYHK